MAQFDAKIFNAEVFGKYLERIPRVKQNKLLEAGVLRTRNELKAMLADQTGGNYITVPMKGLLDGTPLNYDGATDITATSTKTYSQSMVVVGRAKAWVEQDFSADITGQDFMDNVAQQVATYWDDVDQDTILAILHGIFAMSDTSGFVTNHTTDLTGQSGDAAKVNATTLNTAIQKAAGDNKDIFKLVICHSAVATNLENLSAVEYLKYTDAKGVERQLGMATWNGRLLLIDDSATIENGYISSTQATSGSIKVVANSATPNTGEMKLADVMAADYYPAGVAANDYVLADSRYVSYILGDGAFDFVDCGAKVPNEMSRDPKTNGGQDTLYTRQRKLFAPRGISFTKASMASASPTDAELRNGANWAVVNDGHATSKTYINHKAIPIARILSKG